MRSRVQRSIEQIIGAALAFPEQFPVKDVALLAISITAAHYRRFVTDCHNHFARNVP